MSKITQFKGTICEKGYGLIAKSVMIDTNISIGAKALYSYICAYNGNDRGAFPTRERILKELKIGKDSLLKYRKELVENGYLIVEGKFKSNAYNIVTCTEKSDTKEQKQKGWYQEKKSLFNDFDQRAYNGINGQPTIKELEKMLLGWSNKYEKE
ncbi:helix-turn-helix domain-containing protein [Oceanirhabdus seepicola]|uniref:Helix-turn-helix domain-containing protein n=1 Tax=Oceanirhabdus seepicola TaxID=2828781 RepID=A0A9J6PBV4_9CLOT|nr:helix-turn-helix domain-containing protein [Oceanirhabdus seepicola]MCM1992557.1 helix-turn-helix domain-containing protein [Oceanirhabdus seepicola]